jgi:hypothetical protein
MIRSAISVVFAVCAAVLIANGTPSVRALTFGTSDSAPAAEAKRSYEAHGGENLRKMATLIVSGSVDITLSSFQQAIPATFSTAFAGEKYLLEVNSQFAGFKQSFDGVNTVTVPERGFTLPPINRIGLALLQRYEDEGFSVSQAEDKDRSGFRITSPEGYVTDFYTDRKTGLIKEYRASYVVAGRNTTTSVEVKKYEVKEGVSIPSRYDQRFDVAGMTVYAEFKAKEIAVNSEIPPETFGISK